jgi:hypothetical protein
MYYLFNLIYLEVNTELCPARFISHKYSILHRKSLSMACCIGGRLHRHYYIKQQCRRTRSKKGDVSDAHLSFHVSDYKVKRDTRISVYLIKRDEHMVSSCYRFHYVFKLRTLYYLSIFM